MNNEFPRPELLAPAGTLAAALAAYSAGADAVYCGLNRFNAREMGANFSPEDLSRLAAYAKSAGKRFYLTLNTLVKENEWEAFGETVEEAAALDPDAVILQDIGVARFLRTWFPKLELHASTQMGIHNSAGIEAARDLGLSRVILERQVPLTELKSIVANSPLAVEVFIHGALCCSISGSCLFSSWMGGWSGNRGRCKQPCRRRFHGKEQGEAKSGFFFSTQDLYSLDLIDDLQAAGVRSLKIEGRLKQPDYVRRVVQAYRMVLDADMGDRSGVLGEARLILSGSFGRRWSHGFATEEDMETLIQYDSLGVSGQLVGAVTAVGSGGFRMRLSRKIHVGDRLRVQSDSGDEGPSFTLTTLKLGNAGVVSASAGQEAFALCDREVPGRGKVYRVGSSLKGGIPDGSGLALYRKPRAFDLAVRVTEDGIEVQAGDLRWKRQEAFDTARKHPLAAETVAAEFRRTRLDEIALGECRVEIEGNPFLPASLLKGLRREFWDWFLLRIPSEEEDSAPGWRSLLEVEKHRRREPGPTAVMSGGIMEEPLPAGAFEVRLLPAAGFDPEVEYLLPHFCSEGDLPGLKTRFESALREGCRRFRLSSLYQLSLVKTLVAGEQLILTAAHPLPVANALAAAELEARGVGRVQAWLELEREALEDFRDASPLPVEIYRYGRPPLLVTRARVPVEGSISDSRGGRFIVSGRDENGLTVLYPGKPMEIPALDGTADCFDYRQALRSEKETSRFNFDRELV
jgi:U32 family peptidase